LEGLLRRLGGGDLESVGLRGRLLGGGDLEREDEYRPAFLVRTGDLDLDLDRELEESESDAESESESLLSSFLFHQRCPTVTCYTYLAFSLPFPFNAFLLFFSSRAFNLFLSCSFACRIRSARPTFASFLNSSGTSTLGPSNPNFPFSSC
jgi:hypothetical protein